MIAFSSRRDRQLSLSLVERLSVCFATMNMDLPTWLSQDEEEKWEIFFISRQGVPSLSLFEIILEKLYGQATAGTHNTMPIPVMTQLILDMSKVYLEFEGDQWEPDWTGLER